MIRLENLSINLKNNEVLVSKINIFIPSGSLVSITGTPASGKTKLFKIISLQEKAYTGNLFILGKNINKLDRDEIASLHGEISSVNETDDFLKVSERQNGENRTENLITHYRRVSRRI